MKERPSFPLMRQTDVQSIYHMQMLRWLFSDPRYADMSLEAKLKLLDYTILQNAEAKLHANLDKPVRNSTAYTMATIFNCIAESESDLMVDPYLNGLRWPPGRR